MIKFEKLKIIKAFRAKTLEFEFENARYSIPRYIRWSNYSRDVYVYNHTHSLP